MHVLMLTQARSHRPFFLALSSKNSLLVMLSSLFLYSPATEVESDIPLQPAQGFVPEPIDPRVQEQGQSMHTVGSQYYAEAEAAAAAAACLSEVKQQEDLTLHILNSHIGR